MSVWSPSCRRMECVGLCRPSKLLPLFDARQLIVSVSASFNRMSVSASVLNSPTLLMPIWHLITWIIAGFCHLLPTVLQYYFFKSVLRHSFTTFYNCNGKPKTLHLKHLTRVNDRIVLHNRLTSLSNRMFWHQSRSPSSTTPVDITLRRFATRKYSNWSTSYRRHAGRIFTSDVPILTWVSH